MPQRHRRRPDAPLRAGAAVLPARARRGALLADVRDGLAGGGVARVPVEPGVDELLPARGVFRNAPLAETYPAEIPRDVPLRPSLDFDTMRGPCKTIRQRQPLR